MNADEPAEGDRSEGLSTSERAELDRLRTEEAAARHPGRAARFGRWSGAVVLLVVGGLLFLLSVVAIFVRTQVLDTNRYVETVAPLARDPVIQDAITTRLTDEIMTKLDIAGLTKSLADGLQSKGAPPVLDQLVGPITSGVQSFLSTQIQRVVESDTFAQVWDSANRAAHSEISSVLTTGQGKALTSQGTEVSLNVGAILDTVKQKLVAQGFTLAEKVPATSIEVPLFQSEQLPKIRTYVKFLNTAAWLLPLVSALLLLAGVLVAPNRRRGLLTGAFLFGGFLLLLLGGLAFVRDYYLDHLPSTVKSPDAVRVLYDTETRFLVSSVQTLVVLFLIVVLLCLLTGPSRPAKLLRRGVDAGLDAAGQGLGRTGLPLGPVPAFLRAQRTAIRIGVTVLTLVILVLWRTPGIAGLVWLTVGALLLLALLEVVARTNPVRRPQPHPA